MLKRLDKKYDRLDFYSHVQDLDDISMLFVDTFIFIFLLRFANFWFCCFTLYTQYFIVIYLCALNQLCHFYNLLIFKQIYTLKT